MSQTRAHAVTRTGIALAVLAAGCSAAHADAYTELASLRFTPYPISSERPADSAARAPANQTPIAADSSGEDEPSEQQINAITRRVESLAAEQARNGTRSEALVGDLMALAELFEQVGDHDAAQAALERGQHLRRVHDGLYSLEQVEIVEQMIDSRVARGEYGEAAALEQRLLELTGRNGEDPRVANVLSAAGDRQMKMFERLREEGPAYVARETPMNAGNAAGFVDAQGPGRGLQLGALRRLTAITPLRAARNRYGAAIEAAWRNASHDEAGRLELREKLVDTYYLELHGQELESWLRPNEASPRTALYSSGIRVLESRVRERYELSQSPSAIAAAIMELGDWYLLFSRNRTALDGYKAAHDFLAGLGTDDAAIANLLTVDPPRALPLLEPRPEPQAYRGHFDVAFDITKYGQGKHVEVLGRSPGASDDVEKRLKRYIYASRFRPRLVDGHAVDADRVAVRYYFDY